MNKKGFLLFEVIVSIVILSAGLVLVARAFIAAGKSSRASGIIYKTALILEARMFGYDMADEIAESASDGIVEGDGMSYAWSEAAQEVPGTRLANLKIDATAGRSGYERTYSLVTYKRLQKDDNNQ
jgi:hypothetical protein